MAQTYLLTKLNDEYTYSTVKKLQNGKWVEVKNLTYVTEGDKLQITFGKNENAQSWRKIQKTQVNGLDFQSGGQMTVKSDVTVFVTSEAGPRTETRGLFPEKPIIGSEVSLDVFELNDTLFCSIQIEAGDMVRYLAPPFLSSDGDRYKTERARNLFRLGYGNHKLKFILPEEIYNSMPVDRFYMITVTCISYDETGKYVVGEPHVNAFYVYANPAVCKPKITASVKDVNVTTKTLTGDENTLVRYKSTASCQITATAQPLDTTWIVQAKVNDYVVYQYHGGANADPTMSQVSETVTFTGQQLTSKDFVFYADDARIGIEPTTKTVSKNWVDYIEPKLTSVEVVRGNTGDDDTVYVDFYGYFYNGAFGTNGVQNRIKVRYRYREDGVNTWSGISWSEVSAANIRLSGSDEYGVFRSGTGNTDGAVAISGTFDHTKSYTFQFEAYDGNGVTGTGAIVLARSKKVIANCPPSIPVFDWGKADFNFNVPVKINNIKLFDLIYPVGCIYLHGSSTLPTCISDIGTWSSLGAVLTNIYAWKRTA